MRVSTKSWHYRLWRIFKSEGQKPTNLCRYFWMIFWTVIVFLSLGFLAVIGTYALVSSIVDNPVVWAIAVASVIVGALAIAGLALIIREMIKRHRAQEERYRRGLEERPPPREPGITRQYLSARKKKLCPLITVVNPEEEDGLPSA